MYCNVYNLCNDGSLQQLLAKSLRTRNDKSLKLYFIFAFFGAKVSCMLTELQLDCNKEFHVIHTKITRDEFHWPKLIQCNKY